MRIVLIQTDKTQDSYIAEGVDIYLKRLKNYTKLDTVTINVPKAVRQRSAAEQKAAEAELILKHKQQGDQLVLLDEKGTGMTSREFSGFIAGRQVSSVKRLLFVIGGPYGFHASVYAEANNKISLSKMTFSHQMVRLFFMEQLYRAFTIIRGEKYHHD